MRKYCKRTKNWHAQKVKVKKHYPYLPFLMAKVLQQRLGDEESSSRRVQRLPSDPKHIAPTVGGAKEPPLTEELVQEQKGRFVIKSEDSKFK